MVWRKVHLFTLLRKICFYTKNKEVHSSEKCPLKKKNEKQHFRKRAGFFCHVWSFLVRPFFFLLFFKSSFITCFWMFFWLLFFGRFGGPAFGEAGGRLLGRGHPAPVKAYNSSFGVAGPAFGHGQTALAGHGRQAMVPTGTGTYQRALAGHCRPWRAIGWPTTTDQNRPKSIQNRQKPITGPATPQDEL